MWKVVELGCGQMDLEGVTPHCVAVQATYPAPGHRSGKQGNPEINPEAVFKVVFVYQSTVSWD